LSDVLVFLTVLAILVLVVAVVSAPLRRAASGPRGPDGGKEGVIDELEAAREAKYREIRDAELDHETGKLSDQDFEAIDRSLRAEAIEILHAIDRARGL
jgi:Na+-transporting methylmalonyl-CoA/oxaloacetate decarboxylase gamma subunit